MSLLDSAVIAAYLAFSLAVSVFTYKKSSAGKVSYFLGGRKIPWWWAGTSIAATTFAADTPLAVTGLIAQRGFSGNWIWLSWIIMHAATAVFFAGAWRRSEVITDSQLLPLRYSGRWVPKLRLFKAGFYALFFNCLILGWVVKAMSKILAPFLTDSALAGGEVYILMALVMVYSSTGGIRAVLITDLLQIAIAVVGSYALAYFTLNQVGGIGGLHDQLTLLYGSGHRYTNFLPRLEDFGFSVGWFGGIAFLFYLMSQAFSSSPADGGGYLMQRLGTCADEKDARKATMLFIFIQYFLRLWPWVIVGLAALVVFPLGREGEVFDARFAFLAQDREAAYPELMKMVLPTGLLGLGIAGMLAAFMSTVDTHLNWGSSYVVNDFTAAFFPRLPAKKQVLVGRLSTILFAVAGVLVSFGVQNIAHAWKLLAVFGACFGPPTLLRWFWWRVNVMSEFLSIVLGLVAAGLLTGLTEFPFEITLSLVFLTGLAATLAGALCGTPTDPATLRGFVERTQPYGFWGPYQSLTRSRNRFWLSLIEYGSILVVVVASLFFGQAIINNRPARAAFVLSLFVVGLMALILVRRRKNSVRS